MAKWPLSPTKIWEVWKDVTSATETPAEIVLAGAAELVESARLRLERVGGQPRLWNGGPEGVPTLGLEEGDVLVVFIQPAEEDAWADALKKRKPSGAVIVVDDAAAATHEVTWYTPDVFRVSFSDTPAGWQELVGAVLDAGDERMVSLARRYPILREQASERIIQKTARQNGVVGVAFFLPGTDFPVMTLNQMKMVLMLGVIHGAELTRERVVELAGVLGAGFGFRAAARQGLAFIPGPGWALKGSMGYGGTYALGEAALRYFRSNGSGEGRLARLTERAKELAPDVDLGGRISSITERLKR